MDLENTITRRDFLIRNTALGLGIGLAPGLAFGGKNLFSPNGQFTDHGVASPIGQHRGLVATTGADGKDVVLFWLFDYRGGYALLMVDAETGTCDQFEMPFAPGDAPYASLLSSKNKFYTLFKGHFVEFDPVQKAFTFNQATPGAAMALTEDDNGRIWSVTYPGCVLSVFDPEAREFTDYGVVNKENWPQYPRYIAADNKGWVYMAVGYTASQIICFNPETKTVQTVFAQNERKQGLPYLYRDRDGKVYGKPIDSENKGWVSLYEGKALPVDDAPDRPVVYVAGSQILFHKNFKSGKQIQDLDLVKNILTISDPSTGNKKEIKVTYTTEGAIVMGVALGPDQTITGGTAFPMRQFSFNPRNGEWRNYEAYSQFNTVESDGKHLYVGGYPGGFLLRWDPSRPYQKTEKTQKTGNPIFLGEAKPDVYRPFKILIHPNNQTVLYSGGPAYGVTGGGIAIWNKKTEKLEVIPDEKLIPNHSIMTMLALKNNMLLAGTSTAPGTGGEKKATEATLFLMDERSRKVVWQETVLPGVQGYNDLIQLKDGNIAGIADARHFFVWNPRTRKLVKRMDIHEDPALGRTVLEQGPRIFVKGKKNEIYLILQKGIARLDTKTYGIEMVAVSPQPIKAGGAYYDGKIYFVCESHLWSYAL